MHRHCLTGNLKGMKRAGDGKNEMMGEIWSYREFGGGQTTIW